MELRFKYKIAVSYILALMLTNVLFAQNDVKKNNLLSQQANKSDVVTIVCPENASAKIKLAAKEVRR